jgi:cobalt-zinc-cadmium efflux system protein
MINPDHTTTNHLVDDSSRGLKFALGITAVIMAAEITGGIFSNSLSLISDAGHMLVDVLSLALSLIALNLAKRPATVTRTFGLHRAEILAALANGVTLVLISAYIFYESIHRFSKPPAVHTPLMIIVAAVGLAGNLLTIQLLRRTRRNNLNIRAAFFHVFGDTISSVGVIAAGIVIAVTGWELADPIIAIVIGCIILWGAVSLVRESVDILLETVPKNIPLEQVTETVMGVKGVVELHDLHVWTITSGIYALSTHVLIEDQMLSRTREITDEINHLLAQKFNIMHTTFQLENEKSADCAEGLVCQMQRTEETEHH